MNNFLNEALRNVRVYSIFSLVGSTYSHISYSKGPFRPSIHRTKPREFKRGVCHMFPTGIRRVSFR